MKKLFLLLLFSALTARAATYQVALPGGGTLVINGLPYLNPQITNSASVVWTTNADGLLTLAATAVGTNASIVFVEGAAVSAPNFGVSTEIDPAVVTTNVTFSIVNSSITTNKIDPTFYSLLMQAGAGDVTQAGNNTFTGTNIFGNQTTISNLAITTANVGSMTLATPIGVTAVGTNAADARGALGVAYDVDVQAYRLGLLQAALALTADGHMVYHNGTLVTNLLSTTAGRSLLTAADAAAQRTLLTVGQLTNLAYSTAWSNNTTQVPSLGVLYTKFESLPGGSNAISSWNTNYFSVSGGYLDWVGGSTGGGSGGYTYLVTNTLGAWQGLDSSTNWTILSTTISSNDVPTATGRFLDGGWSLIASNNSGTTATLFLDVSVGGTQVFRDSYSFSSGAGVAQRPMAAEFKLIRSSSTTAALVQIGQNVNSSSTPIGNGDFGSTANAATIVVTNIPVTWTSNIQFSIGISCDTSTSTNSALGIQVAHAYLRKEAAQSGGSITADGVTVTGIVSSASITNTVSGGQTTLSVRNSGVTAGTYSNLVAAIGADGRVTSAESATNAVYSTVSATTITATSVTGDGTGLTFTTAAPGTSNTAAATTAFVQAAVLTGGGGTSIASNSFWQATGDLAVGSGSSTATRLPIGLLGDRLYWNGTNLIWSNNLNSWEFGPFEGGSTMSTADFSTTSGNGGAAPSAAYAGEAGHPGVVGGSTGNTTTNGYTGFGSRNNAISGGYGAHFFEAWIKTPSALPSSQPYYLLVGLHDQNSTTPVVDGPGYFRLSTFGDVWQFVSRNNSSETTNSLTAAATADTWYHVRADVATGGSNVVFRLNGSTVATNTSNIPTGTSRAYGAQLFIMEDGGTTNQTQTLLFDSVHAGGLR